MGTNFDLDALVETIAKEILKRMKTASQKVLALAGCPSDLVSGQYETVNDQSDYDYVLMTAKQYRSLLDGTPAQAGTPAETDFEYLPEAKNSYDLAGKRLLHERDLRDNNAQRGDTIKVSKKTIITALAADYAKSIGVKIIRV